MKRITMGDMRTDWLNTKYEKPKKKKCAKNINQRHFVVASTIFAIYIYIWLHLTSLLTNFELKTFIGTNNRCNVRIAPKQYLNIFVHSLIRSFVRWIVAHLFVIPLMHCVPFNLMLLHVFTDKLRCKNCICVNWIKRSTTCSLFTH